MTAGARLGGAPRTAIIAGGGAFNIRAASLRLGDFNAAEVEALLAQHTAETGQGFAGDARQAVWELTRGQPWLVNALAHGACFNSEAGRDRGRPIDAAAIGAAREQLILRRGPIWISWPTSCRRSASGAWWSRC